MKKDISSIVIVLAVLFALIFTGVLFFVKILNPIPENYTEGIKYNKEFPDDVVDLYDDIIVYKEGSLSNLMVLTAGSTDDIQDIRDFYLEFIKDNDIKVLEETNERKDYAASFELKGYMVEIKVTKPKGEYVEDLFESIITYRAKKLTYKQTAELYPTPTPAPASAPLVIEVDSYTSWWSTHEEYNESDFNFVIYTDKKGSMYIMNATTLEMQMKDFTYIYIGSTLTFNFDDGTKIEYTVFMNKINDLVLTNLNDSSQVHNCIRYSEYLANPLSKYNFTATGCWYRYIKDKNSLEVLSLWDNGKGAYFSSEDNENEFFDYEYEDFVLTIHFDSGSIDYDIQHYGNILEFFEDGESIYYMLRANETLLQNSYQLETTTDKKMKKFDLNLKIHGYINIEYEYGEDILSDGKGSWFIDRSNGALVMYNDKETQDYELSYNYHVSQNRLLLISGEDAEITYSLVTIE